MKISENELSEKIIGIAIEIHKKLGAGLLESAYHKLMLHELRKAGLNVESEKCIPFKWDNQIIETGF